MFVDDPILLCRYPGVCPGLQVQEESCLAPRGQPGRGKLITSLSYHDPDPYSVAFCIRMRYRYSMPFCIWIHIQWLSVPYSDPYSEYGSGYLKNVNFHRTLVNWKIPIYYIFKMAPYGIKLRYCCYFQFTIFIQFSSCNTILFYFWEGKEKRLDPDPFRF